MVSQRLKHWNNVAPDNSMSDYNGLFMTGVIYNLHLINMRVITKIHDNNQLWTLLIYLYVKFFSSVAIVM
jgi:hypothetical protein